MRSKLFFVFISLLLVCTFIFVGCDSEGPEATPEPTETATKEPTPEPTPTPTPKPTVEPIAEEKKGIPQKDAEVIFEDNFEEDNLDMYLTAQPNWLSVEDGKLVMREDWTAFIPDINYELGVEHSQYEMTVTFNSAAETDDNPWSSLFIACRGPLDMSVPIATQDGYFWVAFNRAAKAYVYPGGGGEYSGAAWNLKYFAIDLPEDFSEPHKITVVDCGDVICYYMNTAEEEHYLILKATFEEDEIVIFGNDGSEIWREKNMLQDEGSFMFFNHYGKTDIDDIVIKGLK